MVKSHRDIHAQQTDEKEAFLKSKYPLENMMDEWNYCNLYDFHVSHIVFTRSQIPTATRSLAKSKTTTTIDDVLTTHTCHDEKQRSTILDN